MTSQSVGLAQSRCGHGFVFPSCPYCDVDTEPFLDDADD